jgi:hypothetical protein
MWGNLLPPGGEILQASGINLVAEIHMIALTGLIGWPFALSTLRLLNTSRYGWLPVAIGAVAATLACLLLVPLSYSQADGRWASLVWSIETRLGSLGPLYMAGVLVIGFWIWGGILTISLRERRVGPEIVLFLLFMVGFLVQSSSWQRYIEVELLVTLGCFFVSRWTPWKIEVVVVMAWFVSYAVLSMSKLLFAVAAA